MVKRPEEMLADMVANLKSKTGKTMEEWLAITKASGLEKHGQLMTLLKGEHGLTHGFANLIALTSLKDPTADEGDPVDAMYQGAKSGLRPIHDAIMAKLNSFGPDIDLAPKKGYVSVRRSKQFALIQPSTATRVDVGIQLKGVAPQGRLEASGSFNAMVSHRVKIGAVSEVDQELTDWLKQAYDAS